MNAAYAGQRPAVRSPVDSLDSTAPVARRHRTPLPDGRPQAQEQRRFVEMAERSPVVQQRRALSKLANHNATGGTAGQAANRTGLPDQLKSGVESLAGMSMDNVRVHYNSPQPAQLNAFAYAQGNDIHLGPGQEKHLPHEAWHVVQQAQGRVRPTMQANGGVAVNDDQGLEREADQMGSAALQAKGPVQAAAGGGPARPGPAVLQGAWDYSALLEHDRADLLGPAIDVFNSGVKFTAGKGVALYRLAQQHKNKLFIEFHPVHAREGTGGTTQLLFMDGSPVVGHHLASDTVRMGGNLRQRAQNEGLKIKININMNSKMASTTGGIINILVHEFAVHAVGYYDTLKALLDDDGADEAVHKFQQDEGVGEAPAKKVIINALTNSDAIETKKARSEHQELGHGGSAYYKALVAQISDKELNTVYHKWMTSSHKDFVAAQAEDVEGHKMGYDPQHLMNSVLSQGPSVDELSERANALLAGLKTLKYPN